MTAQTRAKRLYPLVILAAEMLMIGGFYLITEQTGRGPIAWLNLAVCMLVVLVNTIGPFLFSSGIAEFSAKIPALAILWFVDGLYTAAALGMMFSGWQWSIEFRVQLLAQLAILLGAGVGVLTSMHATEHAAQVNDEQRGHFGTLDSIREGMKILTASICGLPALSSLTGKASRCAEDARCMTPSWNPPALELESQLLLTIRETESQLLHQPLDLAAVTKLLEELVSLLKQRKACG